MSEIAVGLYLNDIFQEVRFLKTVPRTGDELNLQNNRYQNIRAKIVGVSYGAIEEDFLGYPICDVTVWLTEK